MMSDVFKELSDDLARARLDYENRGFINIANRSCSERLKIESEYSQSWARVLLAERKLELAIESFTTKETSH